jgi:hypothetical protein
MIRETIFGLTEYRVRNLFLSKTLKRCLRRAATPRQAATHRRCIPVGSYSLRSVHPLMGNVSNESRMEHSDHEDTARGRWNGHVPPLGSSKSERERIKSDIGKAKSASVVQKWYDAERAFTSRWNRSALPVWVFRRY